MCSATCRKKNGQQQLQHLTIQGPIKTIAGKSKAGALHYPAPPMSYIGPALGQSRAGDAGSNSGQAEKHRKTTRFACCFSFSPAAVEKDIRCDVLLS